MAGVGLEFKMTPKVVRDVVPPPRAKFKASAPPHLKFLHATASIRAAVAIVVSVNLASYRGLSILISNALLSKKNKRTKLSVYRLYAGIELRSDLK